MATAFPIGGNHFLNGRRSLPPALIKSEPVELLCFYKAKISLHGILKFEPVGLLLTRLMSKLQDMKA